jgi:hypothetical protein
MEISSESTNSVIARPIAIASRVEAALEMFEEKLKEIDRGVLSDSL